MRLLISSCRNQIKVYLRSNERQSWQSQAVTGDILRFKPGPRAIAKGSELVKKRLHATQDEMKYALPT